MEDYEAFVTAKSIDGKIPVGDVHHYIKTAYRIAGRTVYWYIEEALLLEPLRHEGTSWREKYYTSDAAIEVIERAYLITKLKEYMSIKFCTIRNIFRKYNTNIDRLLGKLIPIVKEYGALERGPDPYEPVLNERNAEIVRRVCEQIERGEPLEKISAPDIEEEVDKEAIR